MFAALLAVLCVAPSACRGEDAADHGHEAPQVEASFDGDGRHQVTLHPDDQALGGTQPLVTIVVYSGYACPPCGRMWQVLDNLVEDHGDELRVVARALTLPGLSAEEQAVEAAFAAGAQGRFWPMHRRLYAAGGRFDRATLDKLASELELDTNRFSDELDTGVHTGLRVRHRRQALELGIEFGPVAFVNGRPVIGFRDEPQWHALVERELAEARARVAAGTPREGLYDSFMAEATAGRVELPEELKAAYEQLRAKQQVGEPTPEGRPDPAARYQVGPEGAPGVGPEDAPVVLVAFMDLDCPYCKRLHRESFAALRERYPDDLRIVIRHYPLPMHPNAGGIARAAAAAARQDQFWAFYERVMAADDTLSRSKFVAIADELGLDQQRFLADLDAPALIDAVKEDIKLARRLGVTGTPGLFLNGRFLDGYQKLETLTQRIDEELALARERQASGTPRAELLTRQLADAIPPEQFPNAAL